MVMVVNAPGSFHDSTVLELGDIYTKLELIFDKFGVRSVVDLAFLIHAEYFLLNLARIIQLPTIHGI